MMKYLNQSTKLDGVTYDVRGPVAEAAAKMRAEGMDVLPLNIGNPAAFDLKAPDELNEIICRNLRNADGYSDTHGIIEAREAIQAYYKKKGMFVALSDIYTGNGASELILLVMQALLDHGDEVLVPAPDYPLWTAAVKVGGGNPVHYICDESSGWMPDIEDMEKKISLRTKAIVIINPNNPTGVNYPKEILERIADVARRHGLILFSDEIYDRLIMDGEEHTSIASLAPDIFCITLSGLSKSHYAAGYRVGWMALSGDRTNVEGYAAGVAMLASIRICSNVPAQFIIPKALSTPWPDANFRPGGRIFEQRKVVVDALNSIPGISVVKPNSAFYIFPRIDTERFNIVDDEKFVLDFLREKHVLVVHGTGFNWIRPDHFRVVYLPEVNTLKRAMDSLGDFLSTYRQ